MTHEYSGIDVTTLFKDTELRCCNDRSRRTGHYKSSLLFDYALSLDKNDVMP
jgi:hypothetical protein